MTMFKTLFRISKRNRAANPMLREQRRLSDMRFDLETQMRRKISI
ncbi:hypothetical protein [Celeribacter sp.]